MANPATVTCIFRILLLPPEIQAVYLWLDTGSCICVWYFFSFDNCLAIRRAHPQREFRTFTVNLQRAQVVDQIPGVFGLHDVRERRHWSSIKAGHEDAIELLVCGAALGAIR